MCMVDTLLSNYFQFFQMQMKRNGGGEFLTLTLNDDDVCVTDVSDDESLHLDNDVEEMVEVAPGIFGAHFNTILYTYTQPLMYKLFVPLPSQKSLAPNNILIETYNFLCTYTK
jgi:hypothetical protein